MTKLFGAVVGFLSYFGTRPADKAKIDNSVFRLHYDFTVGFFFLATGLLSLNELVGESILCRGLSGTTLDKADKAITQHCWVSGTYTIPDHKRGVGHHGTSGKSNLAGDFCTIKCNETMPNKFKLYEYFGDNELSEICNECPTCDTCEPGSCDTKLVEKDLVRAEILKEPCRQYHNYYQWVPYLFILQGIMFLFPHRLWLYLEEGKMEAIAKGASDAGNLKEEAEKERVIKRIADFIKKEGRGLGHRRYAFSYLFCTGLNLLNVVVSIFLLDRFIRTQDEHKFLSLGPRWIDSLSDNATEAASANSFLTTIFPREVLCQWHEYGSGGHIQWQVYLCLLASNVITEKVFVFLWFWLFCILLPLSTGVFVYLSLLLLSPSPTVRNYFLSFAVKVRPKNFFKRDDKNAKEEKRLADYLKTIPAPNFLFLYMLAGNVDRRTLGKILVAVQPKEKEDAIYPQIKTTQASAPPSEEVGRKKNGGGGPVKEVVDGIVDEVGEKMTKTRFAGGKAAKEGGATKVNEAKVKASNGAQKKSASPAKK